MRHLKLLTLTIFVFSMSCSKQSSTDPVPSPNPPPPPPPPSGSTTKFVKSELSTIGGSNTNLDTFVYDSQHRLTSYTKTVTSSSPSLNMLYEYNINYTGNNTVPDSYTAKITQGVSSPITLTNSLTYNSSNQIVKDSTISCTLPSYSGIRTIYYEYGNKLVVTKTIYTNISGSNNLESTILDNNGNR